MNKEPLCDLHTHSIYSDGTCSPEQLISLAEKKGLAALALTDHNTVSGLSLFMGAARGKAVEAVPGIEISALCGDAEVHMLGLFLRRDRWPFLEEKMTDIIRRKETSNRRLVDALRKAGYDLDYDALAAATPGGRINRAHIGAAMVKKGYVASINEAVQGVLSEKRGYYQPPERMTAFQAIDLIKQAGGAAVLAHPFLNLTEEALSAFLPQAKAAGLDGMETDYSLFDAQTRARARFLAHRFSLCCSGGSDFHGAHKPLISLGTGQGDLQVPFFYCEQLKKKTE